MRILTGRYKGRQLTMPAGIRPTQNKVRKALFDILGDLGGSSFLELYAGSGAVAFEALSQGAGEVTLVEEERSCLAAIRKNLARLEGAACTVMAASAQQAINRLHGEERSFDCVFLDPPYHKGLAKKTLQALAACDIVAPNGFIIVQHSSRESLPECAGDFILFKRSAYGDTTLSLYARTPAQARPRTSS